MKVGQLPLKASGFWLAESGMNNKGTTPLRPTSKEPAIEPIHGDQYESIFLSNYGKIGRSRWQFSVSQDLSGSLRENWHCGSHQVGIQDLIMSLVKCLVK